MKPEPKVILIYNPVAHGGKLAEKTKNAVRDRFRSSLFHAIEPGNGSGFGDLDRIVKDYQPDFLIIAGGDGTLNKYYNYAYNTGISNIPIGIIPSGTANDFAGSLGITNDIDKAVEMIQNGKNQSFDIMSVASGDSINYCINVFSSGFLTCVSHTTGNSLKNKFGRLAYFIHGVSEAVHPKRMKLCIDSENHSFSFTDKALLVLVMNGRTAGGMRFADTADLHDGLFDIRIFKGSNMIGTLISAVRIFLGKEYSRDVICSRCSSITIDNPDNNETDLDGDKGPDYPVKIECLKGAITIRL